MAMRSCLLLLVALVAIASVVLPVTARNSYLKAHWKPTKAASHDQLHFINLALHQNNVPELKSFVERVSDPQHVMYAQYKSLDELRDMLAPSQETRDELEAMLYEAGAVNVTFSLSGDFASVVLPVRSLSNLFETEDGSALEFHHFTHKHSSRRVLRTMQSVRMKTQLQQYAQLATQVSDFFDYPGDRKAAKAAAARRNHRHALKLKNSMRSLTKAQDDCASSAPDFGRLKNSHEDVALSIVVYCQNGQATTSASAPCSDFPPAAQSIDITLLPRAHPQQQYTFPINQLDCELSPDGTNVRCALPKIDFPQWGRMHINAVTNFTDGSSSKTGSYGSGFAPSPYVTPNTIFERYNVPLSTRGISSKNSQSVVAFENQFIDINGDLRNFAHDLGIEYNEPAVDGLNDPTQPGGESTLDIQYIMGIAQGVPTTFMSLSNEGPAGSGGPAKPPGDGAYILEWAIHISNLPSAPLVTSISYGDTEDGYYTKFGNFTYIDRMEVELAKMAARGLSVLAGSGDAGASNVGEEGNDISDTDPTCSPFRPFYPSNSPYVTSVSSTFLSTNYLPVCQSNLLPTLPIICQSIGEIAVGVSQGLFWTTGGGFSNRSDANPQPSWQQTVVQKYLNTAILPPSGIWNPAGRAYPDVSTIGHNLLMHYAGNITTVDGTSASGPVMAGLISLINDFRLRANQPSLGLLNPFLYQASATESAAFMDVVVGHNNDGDIQPKCGAYPSTCPDGFKTAPGWDAVNGLGTPNWAVLKAFAMNVGSPDYVRTKSD